LKIPKKIVIGLAVAVTLTLGLGVGQYVHEHFVDQPVQTARPPHAG
jgi:hypothetical protein